VKRDTLHVGVVQAQGFASVAHLVADRLGRPLDPTAAGNQNPAWARATPSPMHVHNSARSQPVRRPSAAVASSSGASAAKPAAAAATCSPRKGAMAAAASTRSIATVRKRDGRALGKENVLVTRLRSGQARL
jgi:hypothetical protein